MPLPRRGLTYGVAVLSGADTVRFGLRVCYTPSMASGLDNRTYYDEFSGWYERERQQPYHRMLDDLEVSLVERYGTGGDVLEVGCGTGLILDRVTSFARSAVGIDLSGGMLAKAHGRGLAVAQASATALPVASESVDVAYSFKVLAHIPDIKTAMAEMARAAAWADPRGRPHSPGPWYIRASGWADFAGSLRSTYEGACHRG